jgi:hypothetical protein
MNTQRIKKIVGNSVLTLIITLFIQGTTLSQDSPKAQQHQKNNPQSLTAEQAVLVKTILSQYNASTLTADEAKAIHEKFREAGIQGGPGTKDAIIAAGFDPEKLRALAPPPSHDKKNARTPPTLEERLKIVEEKIIKPLSLSAAQQEKVITAFKEFYAEMEKLKGHQGSSNQKPDRSKVQAFEKIRDEKVQQAIPEKLFPQYLELEKNARPQKPVEDKEQSK